jgi:hypothetical protein
MGMPQNAQAAQNGQAVVDVETDRVKVAFETVIKQMDQQDRTLTNVRNRAIGLFAVTAFVVSISATLGLVGTGDRERFPLWAAILLLVIFVLQGTLIMAVLWPGHFYFGPNPAQLLHPLAAHADDVIPEDMVDELVHNYDGNIHGIERRCKLYEAAILCLLAEVGVIVAVIITVR